MPPIRDEQAAPLSSVPQEELKHSSAVHERIPSRFFGDHGKQSHGATSSIAKEGRELRYGTFKPAAATGPKDDACQTLNNLFNSIVAESATGITIEITIPIVFSGEDDCLQQLSDVMDIFQTQSKYKGKVFYETVMTGDGIFRYPTMAVVQDVFAPAMLWDRKFDKARIDEVWNSGHVHRAIFRDERKKWLIGVTASGESMPAGAEKPIPGVSSKVVVRLVDQDKFPGGEDDRKVFHGVIIATESVDFDFLFDATVGYSPVNLEDNSLEDITVYVTVWSAGVKARLTTMHRIATARPPGAPGALGLAAIVRCIYTGPTTSRFDVNTNPNFSREMVILEDSRQDRTPTK
ncbi:uncharacterized protein BDZ99DRAFT_503709 [Mytilinidion resinicola]|uniref:Uncharacterized protein n=1 Tax=Mytilinidion resinicola TaxID=574789 RepID=A0A6A6Y2F7_9PEZI|nr:uncharacterized protein BDZ99DRAFT_503709 [Mytilinidion resinicola]KAF2802738.1 hypothetical protein BDZ99DRAFT_503709 [Mytilinidion resinicola]